MRTINSLQILIISLTVLFMFNVFLAGVVVFFERRNPASTWAWLLVLFFVPVVGFIVYFMFGRNSKRERVFANKEKFDYGTYYQYIFHKDKYKEIIKEQEQAIKNKQDISEYQYLNDLFYLNIGSGNWVTDNNTIERFINGEDKFNSLINDIKNAKTYIHMEYYIFRNDNLGRQIVSELAKKAKEGVEVKLLYDGMGCNSLPKQFFNELRNNGGEAAAFLPPLFVRINYRDHRKLCVIDGEIGYIGGFNIGDEYLGKVPRYGNWRDTHIRITGDAIDQLQLRFIMDWNFTSSVKVPLEDKYFVKREPKKGVMMQIVSSGPDTKWKNIRNAYFKMINEAEDHIYIETPYFVPDDAILESLKVAALSGIDVRIIFPGNPDHLFVYWASMSYLGELLEAGVRCFQYQNGFIHSKAVFIDGIVSSIGTANMDIRSFAVNFEINAFIFDKDETQKLEQDFIDDLEYCFEITKQWYYNRPKRFRLKESVARLISPML